MMAILAISPRTSISPCKKYEIRKFMSDTIRRNEHRENDIALCALFALWKVKVQKVQKVQSKFLRKE